MTLHPGDPCYAIRCYGMATKGGTLTQSALFVRVQYATGSFIDIKQGNVAMACTQKTWFALSLHRAAKHVDFRYD